MIPDVFSAYGFTWSSRSMNWFTAKNFCEALGKEMPTIESFECYSGGVMLASGMVYDSGHHPGGFCCKDSGTTCDSHDWEIGGSARANKFSSKINLLAYAHGMNYGFWTQSLTDDPCHAFHIEMSSGYVDSFHDRVNGHFPLCE